MKKILIIDDNREILFALGEILGHKNWIAYPASTVDQGIKLFRRNAIDLVLIDYHMPGVNGLEGVKILRGLSEDVPIIVLTVEESQELADAFLAAGADDFALKPIKAPDLLTRLAVHLRPDKERSGRNYKSYTKGITLSTLEIIEEALKARGEPTTIAAVARETGLAYQTVHRYLLHFIAYGVVRKEQDYGKIGRPVQYYRWIL